MYGVITVLLLEIADVYLSEKIGVLESWASQLLSNVAVPFCILCFFHRTKQIDFFDYGVSSKTGDYAYLEFVGAVAFCVAAWYITWTAFWFIGKLVADSYPMLSSIYITKKLIPEDSIWRLIATIYFALTSGIFEEIYYRGLPKVIAEQLGSANWKIYYVILSSIAFGAIHWGRGFPMAMANFGVGLVTAILYLQIRDLRPLIGAHVVIDLIAFSG